MNKISLKYFTGTGNSLRILNTLKNNFEKNNFSVDISCITDNNGISSDCDLAGFCFPVYAFGLPRICRKYLNNLEVQTTTKKAFLIVTAGDINEIGFALKTGKEILQRKNFKVVYSEVVQMPSNWITFINPPTKEEAQLIIDNGIKKAEQIVHNIIEKKEHHHPFNIPEKYKRFQYYSFHKMGVYYMWKMFRTNEDCNSCGLCAKVCSTKSIIMIDGKPKWKSSCEQCMRCVNFCKQQSIYQTYGGNTKGKNRYIEPHFKS